MVFVQVAKMFKKIDFIFSRGAHPAMLRSIAVLEEPLVSDHRPVLAVFDL